MTVTTEHAKIVPPSITSIVLYPLGATSAHYPNIAADEQLVEITYSKNCRIKPQIITALYDYAKIMNPGDVSIVQEMTHKPGAELVDIGVDNMFQFILRARGEQSCKVQVGNLLKTLTAIGAIDPRDSRLNPKEVRHFVQRADSLYTGGAGI